MGSKYSQLTQQDRQVIEQMLVQGCSKAEIARHLAVSPSTIYRELNRNSSKHKRTGKRLYDSYFAHQHYLKGRERNSKLETHEGLRELVHQKLKAGWSPWQIEWHFKQMSHAISVSHETIYRYIYRHWERRHEFTPYLRRKHPGRVKKGSRKSRIKEDLLIHTRLPSLMKEKNLVIGNVI